MQKRCNAIAECTELSHQYCDHDKFMSYFFTGGQFWHLGIVLSLPASVWPSVSPSITKFVCAINHHPSKIESPNLDHRCKRPQLRSLLFLFWFCDWLTWIFSFIFNFKPVIFSKFCISYSLASFCIYLVRPSPLSVSHPTWLPTYTDSYACGQGPVMNHEIVYLYILVRPLEFSQLRLGNWHWILLAAISFGHIKYALHVEILYSNINQSPKQQ